MSGWTRIQRVGFRSPEVDPYNITASKMPQCESAGTILKLTEVANDRREQLTKNYGKPALPGSDTAEQK